MISVLFSNSATQLLFLWCVYLCCIIQSLIILKKLVNTICLLQLGPWLAVEIPELIMRGVVKYKEKEDE